MTEQTVPKHDHDHFHIGILAAIVLISLLSISGNFTPPIMEEYMEIATYQCEKSLDDNGYVIGIISRDREGFGCLYMEDNQVNYKHMQYQENIPEHGSEGWRK